MLAKTRWGYETLATGGNEQAAIYAGIPTRWVRVRAYLLSSLCATVAGLMAVAQDKGASPQGGLSAELIVIAAVIIGGASILGGRGRVIGSFLGALLDRAHQQGAARGRADHPHPDDQRRADRGAGAFLAAGRRRPRLHRRPAARRGADRAAHHPPAPAGAHLGVAPAAAAAAALESGGVAIEGAQTKGAMAADTGADGARLRQVPGAARRAGDHPDRRSCGWSASISGPTTGRFCPNTFAILLNYTELALIAVGLTYVIAAGDIDLSVGAVLALAGSAAAYSLKVLGARPGRGDRRSALRSALAAGAVQRHA